jgi:phage shock protein E
MKKVVSLVVLVVMTLAASLSIAAGPVNLTSPEAKALLAKNGSMVLLDVRTPEEYRQAHLRGSQLIPLSELEKRVQEVPKNKPLLVYCAVGARSLTAAKYLSSKGFKDVYQISDGLVGWYKNGFPIEKGGR